MLPIALLLTSLSALAAEYTPAEVLYQADLGYPTIARELPVPPILCSLHIELDEHGTVEAIDGACPKLFMAQAKRDLRAWHFKPATQYGVSLRANFPLDLRYAYREVPPPTPSHWQWTDDSLVRLGALDRTLAWAGTGAAFVGATTAGLALFEDPFTTYRARYIAFGLGLTTAVVGSILAIVHFGEAKKRKQQRELWSTLEP